jgi:hypothetical protein
MSTGLDFSVRQYLNDPLMPLYPGSRQFPVNLLPNTYYARGRVLGQFTTSANDVQTLATAGGATGGQLRLRLYQPVSMASGVITVAWNASAAVVDGLARGLLGVGNVVVTGGPLNTTPLVFTYGGSYAQMPVNLMVLEANELTGGTPTIAITHTTIGRSVGTYGPHSDGAANGTQLARGLNMYECATDSNGNVTWGPIAIEGNNSYPVPDTPMHVTGAFACEEIVGLTDTAVGQLGRIIRGDKTKGVLVLTGW